MGIARTMVSVFMFVINSIRKQSKAVSAEYKVPLEWTYYNDRDVANDFNSFNRDLDEYVESDLLDEAVFVEGGENPTANIYDYRSNYVWAQDRAGSFMLVPEGLIGPGLRKI